MSILLEIACDSVDDALAADAAGADRIELCSALELGGLTPSTGVAIEVSRMVPKPYMAMIRPRGGDFVYQRHERDAMLRDVDLLLAAGASGVVFGCLTKEGDVDVALCQDLVNAAGKAETVFHRAFDATRTPFEALNVLISLGMTRVLTSGGAKTALEGVARIRQLVEKAAGRIEILPGGGIREHNVEAVVRQTGCGQVHLSRK